MSTHRHDPDFYGWRVVAAAFVVAVFGWGVGFYGPPVYLETVRQARGWPVALVPIWTAGRVQSVLHRRAQPWPFIP